MYVCALTMAVYNQVLRLHPPVPVDGKFSVKDDVWPDGTRIPAKTTVVFPIYVMGMFPFATARSMITHAPQYI